MQMMNVNQTQYTIIKLLGRGKGGYSYLAQRDEQQYVLKQIHHEPCDYYQFGDKIQSELRDYQRLLQAGIRMPKMLDIDIANERVLKEYIHGPTVYELVKAGLLEANCLQQVRQMANLAHAAELNIDYFPTNFIVRDGLLYYIDYECNEYMAEWNFENWGVKYWSMTEEFRAYMQQHEAEK